MNVALNDIGAETSTNPNLCAHQKFDIWLYYTLYIYGENYQCWISYWTISIGGKYFLGGREGYPMNTNAKNHNSKSNIYILFKFI